MVPRGERDPLAHRRGATTIGGMPDLPNDDAQAAPDPTSADLDPEVAAALDASPSEVLGDLADVESIVGDAAKVLEELDAEMPDLSPGDEIADAAIDTGEAPDLSAWTSPDFAVARIDVSANAHESVATPAERLALIAIPLVVVALLAAVALLVL